MTDMPLISVRHVKKSFDTKRAGIVSAIRKTNQKVYAVDDVTFDLHKGEILGLIGESGCGKSTTAKLLLKLLRPDNGTILYKGADITAISGKQLEEYRQKAQIIFQDPYEYLNPRMNVLDAVAEPLVINKLAAAQEEKKNIVSKYLELVGVSPAQSYLYRYPHEMSGGQRQRIAIARALVMEPEFVVADEPTSMLDVSVRAGILNLLRKLKKDLGVSMVFITHDLTTAGYMCDRIAVMYKGRIVETGSRDDIIYSPQHPYTKALVDVATNLTAFLSGEDRHIKDGEVNSYEQIKNCSFENRCLHFDVDCMCENSACMRECSPGHFVACCKC
ncbi:MAG: oligopeptide/dipeptide ABC transporter ATP-binding protein [Clostridiaceae bacterium]